MGFSDKQKQVLRFPYTGYDALICDGAVRSGKTSVMSLSFILWAMGAFRSMSFAICGKTVGSAERNIIQPLLAMRCWGRLYGGAAGIILVRGQEGILDRPLDLDAVLPGTFAGLYILDRWCGIMPEDGLVTDLSDPDFGLPEYYTVMGTDSMSAARIHHSRILRFTGRELPYLERLAEQYWGASEVESLYREVVQYDNTTANMAALTFRANIDTMEVPNLAPLLRKLLPVIAMSAIGSVPEDLDISFPPLWTPTAKEVSEIAEKKTGAVVTAYQNGLLHVDTAQRELKKLAGETGLFDSITDEEIAANKGKTYQDVTALRDPLMGMNFEDPADAGA